MGRIEKTVFISYRHTNKYMALAIYQDLHKHDFNVFFDYESINSGNYEQIIIENIKSRAHFIVVLTPSALDRCNEPSDWLRREIETAIDFKRNIVPVMMEEFKFGDPNIDNFLTGKLEILKKYQGLEVPTNITYFKYAMGDLRNRYLNVELDAVLHPPSSTALRTVLAQQSAANKANPIEQMELTSQEWFERGYVFLTNENSDEAIRCYTEAIRLQPNFIEAYNNRGNIYGRDKGDMKSAIQDFNEAIRLQPNYANAYSNRGNAYEIKGDLESAINDFTKSISLKNSDLHISYCKRGHAHRESGDLDSAIADYADAIRINPGYADAYFGRGIVHQLNGDFEGAVQDYLEAIRLEPDNGSARSSLLGALLKLGKKNEADEQEKLARELLNKSNEYSGACLEAICGNIDKALKLLKIGLEKKQATKAWARQDPDLENLRDDPRFKELVGE